MLIFLLESGLGHSVEVCDYVVAGVNKSIHKFNFPKSLLRIETVLQRGWAQGVTYSGSPCLGDPCSRGPCFWAGRIHAHGVHTRWGTILKRKTVLGVVHTQGDHVRMRKTDMHKSQHLQGLVLGLRRSWKCLDFA